MTHRHRRRGFSLTELLVVITLIAVLLGLLFPALAGIRSTGLMTTSMSNLRQIGVWMRMYSDDNREFIVPSRFDYNFSAAGVRNNSYRGKVRSVITPGSGSEHQGTWSDILWTVFEGGVFPDAVSDPAIGHNYRYDSPDKVLYELLGDDIANPLRSAIRNTRVPINPGQFGAAKSEIHLPGYFAANNFFDADPDSPTLNDWFVMGQIKSPERSMYLVDSFAGEVIEDDPPPFDNTSTQEVDFRYPGDVCLMLFLDGHAQTVAKFDNLDELQGSSSGPTKRSRQIRVQNLDQR